MALRTHFSSIIVLAIVLLSASKSLILNDATNDNTINGNGIITIPMSIARGNNNNYMVPEFEERLDNSQRRRLCKLLSWSNLKKWEFNIFDVVEATNGESPLLFVAWAILGSPYSQHSMAQACNSEEREESTENGATIIKEMEGYHFFDDDSTVPSSSEFHLNSNSMKKLFDFLRLMERDYHPKNPYHNSIHAADVLRSLHALIQQSREGSGTANTGFEPSREDVFSILVAAAVHDVGHPGLNNAFQIHTQTNIAVSYKNVSVLEKYHASHALEKMIGSTNEYKKRRSSQENDNVDTDFNFLFDSSIQEFTLIRKNIVDSILMTDMSNHFKHIKDVEALIKSKDSVSSTTYSWTILRYMLHLADISSPVKSRQSSIIWTNRVMDEFFKQGDIEVEMGLPISPLCDRNTTMIPDSQVGFIAYVVKPSFEVLALAIPTTGERTLPIIESILNYWKSKATTSFAEAS